MKDNEKILIISPHLDDEIIGVGGTLLLHKIKKESLFWINVTLPLDKHKKEIRLKQQQKISNFYGFKNRFQLPFTSTELEGKNKLLINEFSKHFLKIKPTIVYLPNRSDIHNDHKCVFDAAYSCTKYFRYPFIKRVLMYETLSETEFAPSLQENAFIPNVFCDITKHFNEKIEALKIYDSEIMEEPFPRSLSTIEALARYRGSRIGVKYAEAFQLLFEINL